MKLAIYQTSDLHGYVYPTNYVIDQSLGILKIGSYILKDEKNYDASLKIDCGDLIQGSALSHYLSKKDRLNFEDEIMNLDARILWNELINIPYKDRGIVEYFIESMLYSEFAYKIQIRITKEESINVINKIKRILLAKLY